jgi:outer membrane protein assembly factor BamB
MVDMRRNPYRRRLGTLAIPAAALALGASACGGASASSGPGVPSAPAASLAGATLSADPHTGAGTRSTSPTATQWTTYHRHANGSGRGPSALDLSHLVTAWTSKALDGELYGEPLVFGKDVYVATENDTVYALSSTSGTVVWSHHLAKPYPSSGLPCGNIGPTVGITSTPVIDASRDEVFVVADEDVNGAARHEIYGLNAANGHVEMHQAADPPGHP